MSNVKWEFGPNSSKDTACYSIRFYPKNSFFGHINNGWQERKNVGAALHRRLEGDGTGKTQASIRMWGPFERLTARFGIGYRDHDLSPIALQFWTRER